ncbi:SRPBCC family protein [Nocardioides campestrisoli]|uniref:SRPBCC family protein n=1 Tax=Nocardioides campestrisoli TaxID=2736757 RepID=UPI00163D8F65|nr:SRPBCC domain-containing protein [Nocardioides campestrisoli]
MSENSRTVHASAQDVWTVLTDGWLYPLWVVGASRMREVDDDFPAVGSRLHHSVGSWPLLIDDNTEVLEVEEGKRLVLQARAWPTGEARVEIELRPIVSDTGEATEVVMREDARRGPALLIPPPVRHPMLAWRNTESLRRLAYLAERRQ